MEDKSIFFKIEKSIKKFSMDSFFKRHSIKGILKFNATEFRKIKTNSKKLTHLTINELNHKIGEKYLLTKVTKDKSGKDIFDFKNSYILKCSNIQNSQNYYNLSKDILKFSKFKNLFEIEKHFKLHYGDKILNYGINTNSYDFLEKLEEVGKNLKKNIVSKIEKNIKVIKSDTLHNLLNSNSSNKQILSKKITKITKETISVLEKLKTGNVRVGFSKALNSLGRNKKIVVLCADLKGSFKMEEFEKKYKNQFFEVGICEQNMIGMASGMSHLGKIPFALSYASFNPIRNLDQIRISVCYSKENVKIIGGHAGLLTGKDGGTHQCLEDIAVLNSMPNIKIFVPCDENEAYSMTDYISKIDSPCYLRLFRESNKIITKRGEKIDMKVKLIEDFGDDLTIFACGIGVQIGLEALYELKSKGILAKLVNVSTLKPLDEKGILKYSKNKKIITIEDHQINGGLGSIIASFLSKTLPSRIEMIGVKDKFGQSSDGYDLLEKYNINTKEVLKRANLLLK